MEEEKRAALAALKQRRENPPARVNNASAYAGAPMYFYCKVCGALSDTLPESYIGRPKELCNECKALKDQGWL
jgi:hypothetical protein